jgi:SAM-dependent methyltransferase
MAEPTLDQLVDSANAYEALFVPSLLGQFAPKVSDAAGIRRGDRVLDVACGTGVLARAAAERTGDSTAVAGVDLNAGMIEVARRLSPAIDWRVGRAEQLPFPDASFDAVVSQFGLMFFPDRPQAIREMVRVLKPGGRLAVAVWDSIDHVPGYAAEVELLDRVGGKAAGDALRAPFVLGDRRLLAGLFADAGAPDAEITTAPGIADFPSIRTLVEADLRGWLPVMGVNLEEPTIGRILDEAEAVLEQYAISNGRARFPSPAHIVRWSKPAS